MIWYLSIPDGIIASLRQFMIVLLFRLHLTFNPRRDYCLFATTGITADPALGTAALVTNHKGGDATASVTSATYSNAAVVPAGNDEEILFVLANTTGNFVDNDDYYVCPPGYGIAIYANPGTSKYGLTIKWVEF